MKVTKLGGMATMTCLMLMAGVTAIPAYAQVNVGVNIHIGDPPPVVVAAPPTMVLMPEPQMYVAVGVPYDIYFVSGRYYYLHEGHWFWGTRYGGPWTYVAVERLPPGLRRYKVRQLHEFRDREYNVYKVRGSAYHGKYFVAEHDDHAEHGDHDEHRGRGNDHGRGRGNKHD
jgi:hypothetical protein